MSFHILKQDIINGVRAVAIAALFVGTPPASTDPTQLIWGDTDLGNPGEYVLWDTGDSEEGNNMTTTDAGV